MKRICFFGIYDREYPRNKVLLQGFEENGYAVTHCHIDPRKSRGLKKYWHLYQEQKKIGNDFDFVWVAFPGHTCVWLAKLLFRKNVIIFDVFLSLFEANVSDRKVHKAWSVEGLRDKFLDWYGLRLADIVTLDTDTHIKKFEQKYGLKKCKALRIFLSSALPVVPVKKRKGSEEFVLHFHGSFIPLHGVEYVIRAAKLLEHQTGVVFRLVGGGQQLAEMKTLATTLGLTNVEFLGRIPEYGDVLQYLEKGDAMLGIFGMSERGWWVIPNKIFEGMAYGKAILSADTPAMRELFIDRENVLFCQPGDPKDLAEKIIILKEDRTLREHIAQGGQKIYKEKLIPKQLIAQFLIDLKH